MNFFTRIFRSRRKKEPPAPPSGEPAPAPAAQTPLASLAQDSARRVQRAVESILDNEALSQDLEDDAASVLLRWGSAWAEELAQATRDLDEVAAQEALESRLSAVRQMMRSVSRWAANQAALDESGRSEALQNILDQAARARGEAARALDETQRAQWAARIAALADQPALAVAELRKLIEETTSTQS